MKESFTICCFIFRRNNKVFHIKGKKVKILGWGRTTEKPQSGAKPQCDLLETYLRVDGGHRCPSNSETRICVHHGDEKEAISCNGDSGGPLMISGVRYINKRNP